MPPWFVTRTPMPCEFSMVWRSAGPSGALPKASFLITGFSRASEGAPARIEDIERRIIRRRAVFRVRIGVPVNESNILTCGRLLDYMTACAVGGGIALDVSLGS